jgi:serine/threonine protein kinase
MSDDRPPEAKKRAGSAGCGEDPRAPSADPVPSGTAAPAPAPVPPASAAAAAGGRRIDQYVVGDMVSKTKFSTVFKARRADTGEAVALKKIEIFDIMDPAKRQKILREADLIGSLAHPHIIRCLEHFVEDNTFHLVFDWAARGDIKQLVRRARRKSLRIAEPTIWRYLAEAAAAVDYMHSRRIMHRDIKPANLFLAEGGVLKVGDLGLGREFSSGTAEAFSKVGTPLWVISFFCLFV